MSLIDDVNVKLTFSDDTTLDIKATNYLKSFNLLLEMDNSQQSIVGSSSANELVFALNNDLGYFTPTNEDSPYYGLLEEDIRIDVTDGLRKLGTYYVKDWNAPASATNRTATVRAVDRLQSVLNTPVTLLPIDTNIAIKDYMLEVFKAVGFAEADIVIDPSLTQVLDFTISSGQLLSSIINDVCISGFCVVYINVDNKIVLKSKSITGEPDHDLTDSTNIVSVTPYQSMLSSGNTLVLGYTSPSLSDVQELLKVGSITVPPGVSTLPNYVVNGGNVYQLDSVKLVSERDVKLTGMTWTQSDITLSVNNATGGSATCDIYVYGRTISLSNSYIERQNETLVSRNGRKDIKIDCKLIQSKGVADGLATKLWTLINLNVPYLTVSVRDTGFLYNLGEIALVSAPVLKLEYEGYINSINYDWRGGDLVKSTIGIKQIL